MTPALWSSLVAVCLLISLTPGAGAINTMTNSLVEGWRRAFWGILGQQLALVAQVAIVAAGVGLLVASSPLLFHSVRYAGAAYLVYLGVRLMLVKTDASSDDADEVQTRPPEGRWSMVRRGFWVNMLNPKAIVFFLAVMPQFIRLDRPPLPQYLIFITTMVIIDIAIMWGVFAAAARPFKRLTRTPRGRKALNTVFGSLFILVAVLLVIIH